MKKTRVGIIFATLLFSNTNAQAAPPLKNPIVVGVSLYNQTDRIMINGGGVPTDTFRNGSLNIDEVHYVSPYLGVNINLHDLLKLNEWYINFGVFYSPVKYEKSFPTVRIDEGYDGNYGFTADYQTSISVKKPLLFKIDVKKPVYNVPDFGSIGLVLAGVFYNQTYDVTSSGTKWPYQAPAFYTAYPAEPYKAEATRNHVVPESLNYSIPDKEQFVKNIMVGVSIISDAKWSVDMLVGKTYPTTKIIGAIVANYDF